MLLIWCGVEIVGGFCQVRRLKCVLLVPVSGLLHVVSLFVVCWRTIYRSICDVFVVLCAYPAGFTSYSCRCLDARLRFHVVTAFGSTSVELDTYTVPLETVYSDLGWRQV